MTTQQTPVITFHPRTGTGKGVCRKLRVDGNIPVILYGDEYREGLSGFISLKEIGALANGKQWETTSVKLLMEGGKEEHALLREVQRHAVSRAIQHIDLYQLMKGHKVRVSVPISVLNKDICAGVKMGGKFEQQLWDIVIEVDPNEIPGEIVYDVAKLEMGGEVLMKDFPLPASAEMITDPNQVVLFVGLPRGSTLKNDEETGEVAVVAKGKAAKKA